MKKFWHILKKIFLILSALSVAALFVVVLTSAIKKQESLTCKNLTIKIDYDSGLAFLSEKEVAQRIHFLSGGNIIGKKLSSIDFHTLECETEKNPYVADAEIFYDAQQNITVDIIQKRPLLRVLNSDGVGYYISENNERIPLCDKFTLRTIVSMGSVQTHKDLKRDSSVQKALYDMVKFINTDNFLHAFVDGIYVNENTEFDLFPKTGKHVIHFGNANENMEEKFSRLKNFYREGLTKVGWYKYKSISLKYEGQVVCEKNTTPSNSPEGGELGSAAADTDSTQVKL